MNVATIWKHEMVFEAASETSVNYTMDASEIGKAATPKQFVLMGLIGCTGMDVVSILNKMRVKFQDFSVEAQAEFSDEHPKVFVKIDLTYKIKGENLDRSKVEKAVELSMDKYCGVSAMLRKSAEINSQILIE